MPNGKTTGIDRLRVSTMQVGVRTILTIGGPLAHENVQDMTKAFGDLPRPHKAEFVLDMKGVTVMDSAALEALVEMHESLAAVGGTLKIVGLNELCQDILIATRLAGVLRVYEDLAKAARAG
jgi:anti-anti-sigma factor